MMRCASHFHVYVPGEGWRRGLTFEQAEKLEAEINAARHAKAKAAGCRVIMIATPPPREPKSEREIVLLSEED